jgi:hypothetical protein
MDNEEKIKALEEELQSTKQELQATKEHLKKYTAPARTPCVFSNFVFHHFQYQRRSGTVRPS